VRHRERYLISSALSRTSAGFLAAGGVALLFAPDVILPRLLAGFRPTDAWFGQLLAASWLALAVFNWFHLSALLGGIYARPVVMTNATLYFVSGIALLKAGMSRDVPPALWAIFVPVALLATAYAWLLFKGPLARDLAVSAR
jgi:hypothetical protein